jgi:hypothetical protein
MRIVRPVDSHERLTGPHNLAIVYQAFSYLAWDAESEITLNPGCDGPGEGKVRSAGGFNTRKADELSLCSRIILVALGAAGQK